MNRESYNENDSGGIFYDEDMPADFLVIPALIAVIIFFVFLSTMIVWLSYKILAVLMVEPVKFIIALCFVGVILFFADKLISPPKKNET